MRIHSGGGVEVRLEALPQPLGSLIALADGLEVLGDGPHWETVSLSNR